MKALHENKTALVTGASSGIGRSTAIAFAREGAKVAVLDVEEQGAQTTVKAIVDEGLEAKFFKCDVSNEAEVKDVFQQVKDHYGSVDRAFNNAGVEGEKAPIADSDTQNLEKLLNINVKGVYFCLREELKIMLEQGEGAIVNCSSVAGIVGFPGLPHYVTSKHGITGMTKNAALEYAQQNIRVNAVCPGPIETPMIDRIIADDEETKKQILGGVPMGRLGKPWEVAETVIWLCSDKASLITGQIIATDGGWEAQ